MEDIQLHVGAIISSKKITFQVLLRYRMVALKVLLRVKSRLAMEVTLQGKVGGI